MEKGGMGRDRERRDGEAWRGHGVVWSEGGRGSRAHSLKLVVARVLVIAHVLVVTRVLTIASVLVVTHIRSWALAVICEPRLVVGRVRRGSWAMVKGGSSPLVGSGWWRAIIHGQWAVIVVVACVLPWALGVICEQWWLVVVVFGWGGSFLRGGGRFREPK